MDEWLYHKFFEVEQKHWWFQGRQTIIHDLIERRLKTPKQARILDMGCGVGGFLKSLSPAFPRASGLDPSPLAIEFCQKLGLANCAVGDLDCGAIEPDSLDLMLMLDVLEHIEDDRAALKKARRWLVPGGALILTVPAYQFLWSDHDDLNHHKRRYVRSDLQAKLKEAGFALDICSYYNTILFPAALLHRVAASLRRGRTDTSLNVPPAPLNALLTGLFAAERHFLPFMSFPFGLSLIAVARRV